MADVAVPVGARGHFGQIQRQLVVVAWIDSGEHLGTYQAVNFAHDIERVGRVRPRCRFQLKRRLKTDEFPSESTI
jgi:hypothetical protein